MGRHRWMANIGSHYEPPQPHTSPPGEEPHHPNGEHDFAVGVSDARPRNRSSHWEGQR